MFLDLKRSCWFEVTDNFYNAGLELLLGLLGSTSPKQQLDGAVALYRLANKAMTLSPVDAAPPSPTPQVSVLSKTGWFCSMKFVIPSNHAF